MPSPAGPSEGATAKPTPEDASFFMTVPFAPSGSQTLEIKADETAFMSIASMTQDIPIENWQSLGWNVGTELGESDKVPKDCVLHARTAIAHQLYAACPGPGQLTVPHVGGDFVYIVFTDSNDRIARVLQTGNLYNPDTTGLIP